MSEIKEIKITKDRAEEILGEDFGLKIKFAEILANCESCFLLEEKPYMIIEEYLLRDSCYVVLNGRCDNCNGHVTRLIESGEDKETLVRAEKIMMQKKKKNFN